MVQLIDGTETSAACELALFDARIEFLNRMLLVSRTAFEEARTLRERWRKHDVVAWMTSVTVEANLDRLRVRRKARRAT